jgi:hypothetical protein
MVFSAQEPLARQRRSPVSDSKSAVKAHSRAVRAWLQLSPSATGAERKGALSALATAVADVMAQPLEKVAFYVTDAGESRLGGFPLEYVMRCYDHYYA